MPPRTNDVLDLAVSPPLASARPKPPHPCLPTRASRPFPHHTPPPPAGDTISIVSFPSCPLQHGYSVPRTFFSFRGMVLPPGHIDTEGYLLSFHYKSPPGPDFSLDSLCHTFSFHRAFFVCLLRPLGHVTRCILFYALPRLSNSPACDGCQFFYFCA